MCVSSLGAPDDAESDLQLQLTTYLPHNSYLFVGTTAEAMRLREHRDVLWVGLFDREHRVAVELRFESSEATGAAPETLVVLLAPTTSAAEWLASAAKKPFADAGVVAELVALGDDRVRLSLAPNTAWNTVARVAAWASHFPTTHWVEAAHKNNFFNA